MRVNLAAAVDERATFSLADLVLWKNQSDDRLR